VHSSRTRARLWREARDGEGLVGLGAIVAAVEELLTRSPTLCLANLAVLEASRYPMARRGHLFSTMPESDDPLLDTVRTRLRSGTLLPVDRKSRTGWGSGKPCAVCDLPINRTDIEYEVAGGPSGSVGVHLPCYLVWRQESKTLRWSEGERHRRTTDELLAQLRGSKTDLSRFVKAMRRDQRPHLVVSTNAVRAWQEREPQTWAMVCDWLAEQGKSVVQV
jgi:hypothetical protein